MSATIAIIESERTCREQLAAFINRAQAWHCTGAFPSLEAALPTFGEQYPDLVLVDFNREIRANNESMRRIRDISPRARIVAMLDVEDAEMVLKALTMGACAYWVKGGSLAQLMGVLEEVLRGGSLISSLVAMKLIDKLHEQSPSRQHLGELSLREKEILEYLAQGHPYKQIADCLHISINTVRTYVRRLYSKLQVPCRAHAVLKFQAGWGMVKPG
jgi:DNA-binding NarL/FixJ family response regulator